MKKISFIAAVCLGLACSANFAKAQDHPYYLHALDDLRSARWMINTRPGNWTETPYEMTAVKQIDAAIAAIKAAAIWDGKDINNHPAMDEISDHMAVYIKPKII